MPNKDHSIAFWESCAAYFKNKPNVIFDIFNEPYPNYVNPIGYEESWKCFRDGGWCTGISYDSAGMQSLVNAVRKVGAKNVIIVGGLSYSNDFSKWLQYAPSDSLNQIAASAHLYNFNYCKDLSCW